MNINKNAENQSSCPAFRRQCDGQRAKEPKNKKPTPESRAINKRQTAQPAANAAPEKRTAAAAATHTCLLRFFAALKASLQHKRQGGGSG